MSFCCVIGKCQMLTSANCYVDVFDMSKFIPNERTASSSCFHLRKTAAESSRLLLMNMFHCTIRVTDDFGVPKVVISTQNKKEEKEQGKSPKNSKMWNYKYR